ncbi:type IX secretion system membrane protein PorP/SprF [uncultured Winogradskyella sp.]|uniref:PorP/SprF family type IX secretion system membrane protein n=1 Tax=uncultured Winogradskyella sp. TaxID=395353 RepID=UPI0026204CE9|nr:type IX secretion system membrane protein PorP/SprF [uncultured Winogradskyella sp.]
MRLLIIITVLFFGFALQAQQNPHYTQYMYNMNVVNPAYMINEPGIVEVGSLYRTQWVGIDGAPKTGNIFANIPINDKIELSVNYLNDRIGGVVNQDLFNIDFAYRINLTEDLNLSFGLKTGIDNLRFDFSDTNVSSDDLFQRTSKTVLNIGAGAFLFKEEFYVGLSSPNLIPSNLDVNNDVLYQNAIHVFLMGGYVFNLNDDFKLKPSTIVKMVAGAPISFDISANALYLDRFELGASYRYQDAITALAGFKVTSNLRLGYAYDFNTSALNDFNSGSHEFILTYRFDVLGLSKKYSSPRFY